MPVTSPQGTLDFKKVDKITFVGASSNTVIDTTTGSVGIGVVGDALSSNLHVVGDTRMEGNINMLHTSNTASIKLNSNVVTEFPRSKKLIKYPRVALTQNDESGTSGYVAEQTNYSGYPTDGYAYRLFDNTSGAYQSGSVYSGGNPTASAPTTTASDGSTHQGVAITLDLVTKIRLDHVIFTSHANYGRTPVDGTFLGSNNSSTWDVIQTFSGLSTSGDNQKHIINITNSSQKLAYRYIRFVITKTHTSSVFNGGGLLEFRELEYYGVPEYDPEADGVDVKVTSYPNVPNTDWLEVYYDAKGLTDISSGVSDLSGNSINGVVTGATLGTDENIDIFNFDGQNDIIQGTFSGHTLSSGYTMATWIKPGDIGADDYIATFGVGSNGTSFGINFQTVEGAFRAFIWGSSTPGIVAQTNNGAVTKDKWVHVAATFISADGTIHLYIDNKLVATGTGTTLSSISSSTPLVLGARNSGGTIERHANFKMANFRLFNRALTSDEVWQLYAYQKEYFGHGDLSMTLKAGRLGIGTSEPKAALDVRGDVAGRFTRFLTYDHVVHSSTTFNSSPSWPIGQSLSLVSHTWDIPTEYAALGRGTLNGYAYVSWSGSCPNPWQAVFWIDIYYNGVYMGRGSTNSDVGNTSANHGNTTVALTHHGEDNNSTLDSANVTTGFRLPNCNLSRGSTIKIDLVCQRGDYQSGENVVWTNRNHTAPSSNARDYEQGTTNFFVLLNVE